MIHPTCETCRFWEPEDEECRIRSVPDDNFPIRLSYEWCGEHRFRSRADEQAHEHELTRQYIAEQKK